MDKIWINWWPRWPSLRPARRSLRPVTGSTRWRDRAPPPGPSPTSSPATPPAPSGAPPHPPAPPRPGPPCPPPAPPPATSPPRPVTSRPPPPACPSPPLPGPPLRVKWASTLAPLWPPPTPPLISSSSSMSGISPSKITLATTTMVNFAFTRSHICWISTYFVPVWNYEIPQDWEQNWNIYKLLFCQRNLYLPMDLKKKVLAQWTWTATILFSYKVIIIVLPQRKPGVFTGKHLVLCALADPRLFHKNIA